MRATTGGSTPSRACTTNCDTAAEDRIAPPMTRILAPPPVREVQPGRPTPTFSVVIAAYQVADVIGGSHVDERVELIVHVCLGLAPAESPSRNGREPIQEHQAPSRTLMTANDTRFHRSRCCSSWRLPEAVSR